MPSKEEKARRKQVAAELARAEQAAHAAHMPLDRPQLEDLLDHLERHVELVGCDHSTSATKGWARKRDIAVPGLLRGLAEYGGYCDCEVVMNVDPDYVFVPVRHQQEQAPTVQGRSRAGRDAASVKDFWVVLQADRRVWCLTTDRGLMPWGDSLGRLTLPLWGTEEGAAAEAAVALLEEDFRPGDEEVPLPVLVADLPGKLVSWSAKGVEVIFLDPLERRAAELLTLGEFAAELDRRMDLELTAATREAFDELVRTAGYPRLP